MKVILQVYPIIANSELRQKRRPSGRDPELYQDMLRNLAHMSQTADKLGYWGITHVEHHFHSEGLEISPEPGILNLYLGMHTEKIRMGQLGYVLPTRDPIRLAEETSIIDHMLKGRFFVGLARGYQRRWTNVLGQKFGVMGTYSDQSDIDRHNREIFEEHFFLLKKAWTEDAIEWRSEWYHIPFPPNGADWPPAPITRVYGTPGEVDEEGRSVKISVVPKPYQQPHPPLFQAFSVSPRTIEWCAEQDITPTILSGPLSEVDKLAKLYAEVSQRNGRDYKIGQHNALVRQVWIVKDRDEIEEYVEKYDRSSWDWFGHFGFYEALRLPGEEGPVPKPGETLAQRMMKADYLIAGTLDDVKRRIAEIQKRFHFEYWVLLFHHGEMSNEVADEQLERFAKVMAEVE